MLLCVFVFLFGVSLSGGMESEIIGGKVAKPHSRPYMASLQSNRQHKCGGMLIKANYILTSAHCMNTSRKQTPLEVVLGAHNISREEPSQQRIQVQKYIRHPLYIRNNQMDISYDIMLLKLKTKAKLNKFVKVIGLPKKNGKTPANVKCSVAGWGINRPGGAASSLLQEVTLKLQFSSECRSMWQQYFSTERMICSVADGTKAFCQGDSGGPLICNSKPQGLAAYTYPGDCTKKKYPEIYMKISAFLPWIKKETGDKDDERDLSKNLKKISIVQL